MKSELNRTEEAKSEISKGRIYHLYKNKKQILIQLISFKQHQGIKLTFRSREQSGSTIRGKQMRG